MSAFFLLFLIGIVINIVRAVLKQNRKLSRPPQHQRQPQRPASDNRPASLEQTAHEWIFGAQTGQSASRRQDDDPEGITREWASYADDEEARIHPVQSTLREDIRELKESEREIVHASVHETVRVRRPREEEAAPPSRKQAGLASLLSRQDVARAVVLSEILGEPRAKRPWQTHTPRRKK
jgi:hypothetical protein